MPGQLLVGRGSEITAVPDTEFLQALEHIPARMTQRLAFMTPDHHLVRDFVVREIPRQHVALSPLQISGVTGLNLPRVHALLDDLERNLFFLVRDAAGNVAWAFPVTTEPTKHGLTFSTGERTFGA